MYRHTFKMAVITFTVVVACLQLQRVHCCYFLYLGQLLDFYQVLYHLYVRVLSRLRFTKDV